MAAMSLLSQGISEYVSVSLPEGQESVNWFLILLTTEFTRSNFDSDVSTVFLPLRGMSVNFLTDTSYRWLASSNLSILSSAKMSLRPARSPFLKVLRLRDEIYIGGSFLAVLLNYVILLIWSTRLIQEIAPQYNIYTGE